MRPSPAYLNRIRLHERLEVAFILSHENHGIVSYLFPLAVAHLLGNLSVEDRGQLTGRLQSRLYNKTIEGRLKARTAFDVSIMSLTQEDIFPPRSLFCSIHKPYKQRAVCDSRPPSLFLSRGSHFL